MWLYGCMWHSKHKIKIQQICTLCTPGRGGGMISLAMSSDVQGWANLDQAHEDLDRNIFRDLSPTPKP